MNVLEARIRAAIVAMTEEVTPGSIRPLELNQDAGRLAAARQVFARVGRNIPRTPAIRRHRQPRAWHRLAAIASIAVVIGGGAVLAAAGLVPGGSGRPAAPGLHGVRARLTAWSVTKGPGHTVIVTINQLSDPAGLQGTLRADGVPAVVAFQGGTLADTPPVPPACQQPAMSIKAGAQLQARILGDGRPNDLRQAGTALMRVRSRPGGPFTWRPVPVYVSRGNAVNSPIAFTIHTAEIPRGIGLNLTAQGNIDGSYGWSLGLVVATAQCTGS